MTRLTDDARGIVAHIVGQKEADALLALFGGAELTRLTPDDKDHLRRLIAIGQTGIPDPDAGYTGKGIRHDFHLVDVAARWLRMAKRR